MPLKILVVLPLYGGSLPVGRYCADALTGLGHMAEVFEAPDFYPSYKALERLRVTTDRLQHLESAYLQVISQAILAKVETFQPDLVLAMAQAPLSLQALKRLRRDGVPTAMWFVEDHKLFPYWQTYAPFYDYFAVIQREPFSSELSKIGVANVLYLPMAAHPKVHRQLELSASDHRKYGSDVSFMGAGYPNRRVALREFVGMDFKLWGTEWEGDPALAPYVQMGGARVSSEDCVKIFNATKVNINLHSSIQADDLVTGGDFINPRTFEVASCGAFQVVDKRLLMTECFEEGELATFTSMAEFRDMVRHFLAHPDDRHEYARRGQERVLREHTYVARMKTLLDFVAERLPGWPLRRDEASAAPAMEGVPVELAGEISALLNRLGLPPDAAFEDLVWAVRQQQGQLGELDSAVLFLDEWRKLYGRKGGA